MKRSLITAILIALVCGAMMAILVLHGGLFFPFFPRTYSHTVGAFQRMGYDFSCSDLHGGWRCRIQKAPPIKLHDGYLPGPMSCREDSDCLVTPQGACAVSALAGGQAPMNPSFGECKCLHGPVFFGCVPRTDTTFSKQ